MPEQIASARASRRGPRWRRRAVLGVAVAVTAVVLATVGRRGAARFAREIASSHMNGCEFGAVQWWAGWCALLDPSDYHADLLRAACYRQLGQTAAWQASLDEAAGKNAPPGAIAAERKLDQIRNGEFDQGVEAELGALTEAGASQTDVAAALVLGYLARSDAKAARLFLEKMSPYFTDGAQQDYLWGIFLLWQEDRDVAGAQARLARVLEIHPGHELARTELGTILQADNDLEGALAQFAELAARSGGSIPARIGLAHVLRKMGRIDEARSLLTLRDSEPEPGPVFQFEMAQIALEAGDYEDAQRLCRGIPLESINAETLNVAALALTFQQKPQEARRLSLKAAALDEMHSWEVETRFRFTADPGDLTAAKERARLTGSGISALIDGHEAAIELPGLTPTDKATATAGELFRVHCSECHGPRGDGQGMAAHYLFPRPRNLRAGICQLVSTVNGVPTLEDVEEVLARGMPGTSMQSFEEQPASDRRLLAEEVMRLRAEGIREQMTAALRREGEEIDESDLRQAVLRATTPGKQAPLPAQWPDPGQAALRGKANFATLGCVKCHGKAGTGAADQDLFDDLGEPSRPRDLVHEPFKGGREREAIYRRIVAGMPGTAHPAVSNLPQEQVIELVDYVRSLAQEPPVTLTNHERRVLATTPAYLDWIQAAPVPGR
jgi:mono/diheme cytochrome c family protein/thioredoxin-like negative regulator of GroEL